jgi:predicted Rossmann fold flavoprotein
VLIIDHSTKLAEKIRISGGGRCNFTNINTSPENYISQNKHFAKSALSRYTPHHFMELLDHHNISYHEKTLGQLFCDNSSQDIIDMLDNLCQVNHVKRMMNTQVTEITKESNFRVVSNNGTFEAECLVIATGGLSIPQIGATAFGYNLAKQFGMNIVPTSAALVPLTLDPKELQYLGELSGISMDTIASIDKANFRENSLFTHRGLSGPAVLQISSYWNPGQKINFDLLPSQNINTLIDENKRSNKLLSNLLSQYISSRAVMQLLQISNIADKSISQLSNYEINKLSNTFHNFGLIPSGTVGYKKAEVTKGGVSTQDLDSKTLMAKNVNGLYFIGEVVDVTGWLGGYNFQWAWASAYAAASSMSS